MTRQKSPAFDSEKVDSYTRLMECVRRYIELGDGEETPAELDIASGT